MSLGCLQTSVRPFSAISVSFDPSSDFRQTDFEGVVSNVIISASSPMHMIGAELLHLLHFWLSILHGHIHFPVVS